MSRAKSRSRGRASSSRGSRRGRGSAKGGLGTPVLIIGAIAVKAALGGGFGGQASRQPKQPLMQIRFVLSPRDRMP